MKNLTFSQKRSLTIFALSVRVFFMGVGFAVIFPSIWLYLQIFHVEYWYLGLVLSASNTVGIASAILVGHLADGDMNLRFSGLVFNLAEVVGNIIYSLHFHMSLPLLGRMVSGFGEGYVVVIWAELARITTKDERTRYFSLVKGTSLLGSVIGPALNLFLKEFDFYIGNWHIDFRTSPGFFMAVMWILVTAIMFVFAYDLSDEMRKNRGYEIVSDEPSEEKFSGEKELQGTYSRKERPGNKHDDVMSFPSKNHDVMKDEEIAEHDSSMLVSKESNECNIRTFKDALLDIFSKFHVFVVAYCLFLKSILRTSLSAIIPLVTERMLNWSETNVSLLFTIWAVEIITVLIFVWMVSPKVSDRLLLLVSAVSGSLASVGYSLLTFCKGDSDLAYCVLLVTIFFAGIAIGVSTVIGRSLVSKHTNPDNQGMVQATLTAFNRLACVLGPLLGSSLFAHQKILAIILSGSQFLGLILVILAFNKLKVN